MKESVLVFLINFNKKRKLTKTNFRRMTMRKSWNILLVLVALAFIGCASDGERSVNTIQSERQKAIDWIKRSNNWGHDDPIVTFVTERIDKAIRKRENIWIAIGYGLMKSGNNMKIYWIENEFSVKEISDKEAREALVEKMEFSSGIFRR